MIDEVEVAARKRREELAREVEVVKAEWEGKNKGKAKKKDGEKEGKEGEKEVGEIHAPSCLRLIYCSWVVVSC